MSHDGPSLPPMSRARGGRWLSGAAVAEYFGRALAHLRRTHLGTVGCVRRGRSDAVSDATTWCRRLR